MRFRLASRANGDLWGHVFDVDLVGSVEHFLDLKKGLIGR